MFHVKHLAKLTLLLLTPALLLAQQPGFNYEEANVPTYVLPEALALDGGDRVMDEKTWTNKRRPEILDLFATHVYGRMPGAGPKPSYEVFEQSDHALDGKASRKQVRVTFGSGDEAPWMDILLYLPANASGATPVFVGLNFGGNHTVRPEPEIRLSDRWMRDRGEGIVNHRATEMTRGSAASRWAVEEIVAHGYGVATIYCGDLDPDFDDGFENGVHRLFDKTGPDDWGTIGAWAWGLSRALDYFETDGDVNHERVAVMGHSRLGKAALWAGAADERFAMVISNDSGCGGAALSRRRFGETVERINTSFPHWFAGNFKKYNDNEDGLPVDSHMLLALMAPRPVYVASALEDQWADPRGEFLSAKIAGEVYELFGKKGLGVEKMPAVEQPAMGHVGYHIRRGKHDVTDYDWARYIDFADKHFRR